MIESQTARSRDTSSLLSDAHIVGLKRLNYYLIFVLHTLITNNLYWLYLSDYRMYVITQITLYINKKKNIKFIILNHLSMTTCNTIRLNCDFRNVDVIK